MVPTADPAQERRLRLTGIALMCAAVLLFAGLDAMAKYLGTRMDTMQVVAIRFLTGFLLGLLAFNPFSHPSLLKSRRPGLQAARGLMLLGTTVFNFISFRYLQLDEALAIMFSTPFLVAALAGPMLGEWVGWRRWIAICVGFAGVLVVIRPGFGGAIQWAALLSVMAAIFYSLYGILTRLASRSDPSETTLFYGNVVCVLAVLPVLPLVWTTPETWLDVALLLAIGGIGSAGHFLLIVAHRRAPASVLSPFMYTQLLWATALGYLVFADVPNRWTLVGAAIVVASGLYLLSRERKVTGRVVPVEPR